MLFFEVIGLKQQQLQQQQQKQQQQQQQQNNRKQKEEEEEDFLIFFFKDREFLHFEYCPITNSILCVDPICVYTGVFGFWPYKGVLPPATTTTETSVATVLKSLVSFAFLWCGCFKSEVVATDIIMRLLCSKPLS